MYLLWLSPDDRSLLDVLESEVSADGMWKHMENIMEFSKEMPYMVAGSPREEAAFKYMKGVLDRYGVPSRSWFERGTMSKTDSYW